MLSYRMIRSRTCLYQILTIIDYSCGTGHPGNSHIEATLDDGLEMLEIDSDVSVHEVMNTEGCLSCYRYYYSQSLINPSKEKITRTYLCVLQCLLRFYRRRKIVAVGQAYFWNKWDIFRRSRSCEGPSYLCHAPGGRTSFDRACREISNVTLYSLSSPSRTLPIPRCADTPYRRKRDNMALTYIKPELDLKET